MGTSTRDIAMADQNERAFQKQPTIFLNKKGGLKPSESRFFCNPGLGFKIPAEAKTGNYIDKKCPFVGKVSIRGRVLTGVITKMKITGLLSSGVIISITLRNTTGSRRDTRTCLCTCLPASEIPRLGMLSLWASAGLCPRQSSSTL